MFRELRRKKQMLSEERAIAILEKSTSGVLALLGDDDYAYGVPMSFAYKGGKLYFHSAVEGHKIDAINKHDKVSFAVIEKDQVKPAEFTTYYRSVIVFGRIGIVEGIGEKREALKLLAEKYSPGFEKESIAEIENGIDRVKIPVLSIEHISGKEAKELVE